MNFSRQLLALLLSTGVTVATAQSSNQSQLNASPGNDHGASAYGNNTYSSGTEAQKAEPNPQNPATPQPNPGESKGGPPSQSAASGNSAAPAPTPDDSAALQSRIADALRNEPTLGASHVSVNVTERTIELSGTVGSGQDKQTAERIAASFDGNRQLTDKLVVTGRGHSDLAPGHPALNNGGTGNAPNPAMNPPQR